MLKIADTIRLITKTLLTEIIPVASLFVFGYTLNKNNSELDSYVLNALNNDIVEMPIINNTPLNQSINISEDLKNKIDVSLNVMVKNETQNSEFASLDTENKTNPYNITINLTLPNDN